MNEALEFLVRHGAAVLFAAVFVEQIGIPLPAAPWLLAAGAPAGDWQNELVCGAKRRRSWLGTGQFDSCSGDSPIVEAVCLRHSGGPMNIKMRLGRLVSLL